MLVIKLELEQQDCDELYSRQNMASNPLILIFVTIFLTVYALPTAFANGGQGCYAPPMVYGSECRDESFLSSGPGLDVQYTINVKENTQLCCKALSCRHSCSFVDIGCGSGSWHSTTLPWGYSPSFVRVKCKGNPLGSSFTFGYQ
ncbi:uncharacterized protein LOC123526271 [Mercenaria mercenaria]|uniref:uncharacterized protein LOC123526271 n=1 Tax=Mercenaria mercenaria TaxID=6596 RepID=UPI00234F8CE9|nr:uncharacterized protein LOC123526271 [Mercenaria mercenaria]